MKKLGVHIASMRGSGLTLVLLIAVLSLCVTAFARGTPVVAKKLRLGSQGAEQRTKSALACASSAALDATDSTIVAGAVKPVDPTSSARLSSFNLAKCVGGVGVFSLPAGVALFSDSKKALVPAATICVMLGLVAAYTFILFGRACAQYNTKTLQETWARAVGEDRYFTHSHRPWCHTARAPRAA